MRALVHDPMNTRSTGTSVIGVPGVERHVFERTRDRVALALVAGRLPDRARAGDGHDHVGPRAPRDERAEIVDFDVLDAIEGASGSLASVRQRDSARRPRHFGRRESPPRDDS